MEVILADEFNDIPIKPQININSATVKIRFITVLAFLALLLRATSSNRVNIGYTLLSPYGSRENKQSRLKANARFDPQVECRPTAVNNHMDNFGGTAASSATRKAKFLSSTGEVYAVFRQKDKALPRIAKCRAAGKRFPGLSDKNGST